MFNLDTDISCLCETWLSSAPATPSWLSQPGLFTVDAKRISKLGRASGSSALFVSRKRLICELLGTSLDWIFVKCAMNICAMVWIQSMIN